MKETDLSYIAGVVDSIGLFRADVREDNAMKVGFSLRPSFRINRSGSDKVVLGMIDEYCQEHGVNPRINDKGTTTQLEVRDPDELRQFFGPLEPYIIQQHEQLAVFMGELVPAVEEGKHTTKEGFIKTMDIVDKIYEKDSTVANRQYDAGHFKRKWSMSP